MVSDKLEPNDPLNRRLVLYAQAFNDLYAAVMGFVDGGLRQALERELNGWLDFKLTVDRDKLIVRRRLRKTGETMPVGAWRHIPVDTDTVADFFERVKPEEPHAPPPVDIDASARRDDPQRDASEAVRQLARQAKALVANLERTRADALAAGVTALQLDEWAAAIDEVRRSAETASGGGQ